MPKLPPPPTAADLAAVEAAPYILPPDAILYRIYKSGGRYPARWNSFRYVGPLASGRFDHHQSTAAGEPCLQARGIMYLATEIITCVAEVFQEGRVVDRQRDAPYLAGFSLAAPVPLLDLRDLWPTRAGASALINCDERRPLTHQWSAAIYEAYPILAGLAYGSAMAGNRLSFALYERAIPALPPTPLLHQPLSAPGLVSFLAGCCERLGYDLV